MNQVGGMIISLAVEDNTLNHFLFIHCKGGLILSGLGLCDIMTTVLPDVFTLLVGAGYSMGALVAANGVICERIAYPNASSRANEF